MRENIGYLKITKIIILINFIFVANFKTSAQSEQHTLSVGWELWYPYQYHNKKQELVGLDFDVFNAILQELKLSVDYTELPWKRHLLYLKTGQIDVAMGASFSNEREGFAHFTEPYRLELVKLYVKKGHAKKMKLTSLGELTSTNFMLGVESGYYYGKNYQSLIKSTEFRAQINESLDLEQNIELLLKGHIDGFLVDPITMKVFVEKYRLEDEFEVHSVPIYQDSIHIMLSKKTLNISDLNEFNGAIKTLKDNGKLTKIINSWTKLQSR